MFTSSTVIYWKLQLNNECVNFKLSQMTNSISKSVLWNVNSIQPMVSELSILKQRILWFIGWKDMKCYFMFISNQPKASSHSCRNLFRNRIWTHLQLEANLKGKASSDTQHQVEQLSTSLRYAVAIMPELNVLIGIRNNRRLANYNSVFIRRFSNNWFNNNSL